MRRPRRPGVFAWSLVLVFGLAVAIRAGDVFAEDYLILSLIGDRITIVTQEQQVGSRIDRNGYQVVPRSDPNLDNAALLAVEGALRKVRPDASVTFLRATDPSIYTMRNSWLETDTVNVRELLAIAAKQSSAPSDARLLLITPYMAQPELRTTKEYRGTGKVAGLGFYLDGTTMLYRLDTRESARGFLGVFANFQLILINLQSKAIEAHERIVVGTTYAAARAPDKTPWNALSPEEKGAALNSLMTKEIERVLPKMLVARQP